jgi:hypothetical protein
MSPPRIEDSDHGPQEAASILLLQVALRLLGEARLRGDFGDEAELADRAAAIADELSGGAPSPDPPRPLVEVDLIRPDRIGLTASFREGDTSTWRLMLDGTLYDGGGVSSYAAIDPEELSPEEMAEVERQRAEWQAELDRQQQFTATRFVRAVPAPPQTATATRILAALLYEDGFYVEITYDKEPPSLDLEMDAEQVFALAQEGKPEITVEDDLGTEYFESGGGWGGGIRVSHSSFGFAPAPPPEARLLLVSANGETVGLDLPPQSRTEARQPSDAG